MYLYAMQKANLPAHIKIGYTKDLENRRKILENQTGERLKIIYHRAAQHPRFAEKYVHRQFSGDDMLGEWFNFGESESRVNLLFNIMNRAVDLVDDRPKKLAAGSATENAIREAILARILERSASLSDISIGAKISQNKVRLVVERNGAKIPSALTKVLKYLDLELKIVAVESSDELVQKDRTHDAI